ncbi:hypothetical protein K402DRAFT_406555 [Aulographum hederae CBS 113979]|uniref:RING-type E3 ubiquitin transferase n=1 Tax=Aulographum hederae CBS 113979 TaxID=1176131 RepID=A0A6G1GSS0_9PEZI|nr:hypothetical protein K402DRAFT_406555 [Aulographum hederae CBS 113979]
MRPLRLLLTLSSCIVAITLLLYFSVPYSSSRVSSNDSKSKKKGSLTALFSFHTPLFPPSAIISLTEDNQTFFLARPAAFGPSLPSKGLSGQIWIGSGFGDDAFGRGGLVSGAEGELGCSDVPGWDESLKKHSGTGEVDRYTKKKYTASTTSKEQSNDSKEKPAKRLSRDSTSDPVLEASNYSGQENDGTDNHLKPVRPVEAPARYSHAVGVGSSGDSSDRADIKSLQETAEIGGKIVLLSRGGCGFYDKVKWAQRRGGVALIVGDDIKGGPLVTMYAKGDNLNVTIPALFTSYTTAHLLSSLMEPSFLRNPTSGKILPPGLGKPKTGSGETQDGSKGSSSSSKPVPISQSNAHGPNSPMEVPSKSSERNWFAYIMSLFGSGRSAKDASQRGNRRPPSSGQIDWELPVKSRYRIPKKTSPKSKRDAKGLSTTHVEAEKEFVIGVQDWRDPDLVASTISEDASAASESMRSEFRKRSTAKPKGGSTTPPSSGEYEIPPSKSSNTKPGSQHTDDDEDSHWLNHLRVSTDDYDKSHLPSKNAPNSQAPKVPNFGKTSKVDKITDREREGLWITLTPTNMSSSPFLDTLLVLVVSPLVTLTIVYALLLLRSRIRRRRWRAPKSVVERLPVRTYHTLSSESSGNSTSLTTPVTSSPTTPLLQTENRSSFASRSRPRSRTTSEVPDQTSSSSRPDRHDPELSEVEKREHALAEWRRRYGGRQKECVVCLEEYEDGVSRVMSLPCGHEFHAECITPWLTTRRRTCPICKGDVVRSLARGSGGSAVHSPPLYRDAPDHNPSEEEVQAQAAENRNDSPSAAMPMPTAAEMDADLERGDSVHEDSRAQTQAHQGWSVWDLFGGSSSTNTQGRARRRGSDAFVDRNR